MNTSRYLRNIKIAQEARDSAIAQANKDFEDLILASDEISFGAMVEDLRKNWIPEVLKVGVVSAIRGSDEYTDDFKSKTFDSETNDSYKNRLFSFSKITSDGSKVKEITKVHITLEAYDRGIFSEVLAI